MKGGRKKVAKARDSSLEMKERKNNRKGEQRDGGTEQNVKHEDTGG